MNDALVNEHFRRADLVAEVAAHNCAVAIARQRGDWSGRYRNAITEIEALTAVEIDRAFQTISTEALEDLLADGSVKP